LARAAQADAAAKGKAPQVASTDPAIGAPADAYLVPANDWRADPVLAARVEETLATLTLKRRRSLLSYLDSGNGAQSVRAAGYGCGTRPGMLPTSPRRSSPRRTYNMPSRHCWKCADSGGRKLDEIHALHLSRHSSPDAGDRDRSLRALALAHKYLVPKPSTGVRLSSDPEHILDEMTPTELERFGR